MNAEQREKMIEVVAEAIQARGEERWRELVGNHYDHVRGLFLESTPVHARLLAEAAVNVLGIEYRADWRFDYDEFAPRLLPAFTIAAVSSPDTTEGDENA